jgi:mRNA interferase MazF
MKRGEIWTIAGGPDYSGKPRPAVVLQDDRFDATGSITLCPFTSDLTEAPLFRLAIEPATGNGLRAPSRLMVDKISTVARTRLGARIGRLDEADMIRLNRSVLIFLGLTLPARSREKLKDKPAR